MEEAHNCVISEDFILKKRPGFYTFHAPVSGTLNNLCTYNEEMILAYGSKLQHITSGGVATDNSGTYSCTSPKVARFAKAKDNLYITSDNGVMKLTSPSSAVTPAGIPPALDLTVAEVKNSLRPAASQGVIHGDVQVAYRILFGKKDANNNILLGAPSNATLFVNPKVTPTSNNYTSSGNVVTITSVNHGLIVGNYVTIIESDSPNANGEWQVLSTPSADTFTFDIGAAPSPTSGRMSYKFDKTPRLYFTIPTEISGASDSSSYFYQIYRTTQSSAATATPDTNFALLKEAKPTSTELTNRAVVFDDTVDDVFLENSTPLYTNENSGEGEAQENSRPPLCEDMALFKDMMIYLNCRERHLLNMQVVDTTTANISDGNTIQIKQGGTTTYLIARSGLGNKIATSSSVVMSGNQATVTYPNHGFQTGDFIFVHKSVGTGTQPYGEYEVGGATLNTFDFLINPSAPSAITYLDFQGIKDASFNYLFCLSDSSVNLSAGLQDTALGIVRAVNRVDSSPVYASYISGVDDLPGKFFLESKTFSTDSIQFKISRTTSSAFYPSVTNVFTDTQSDQTDSPNEGAVAKVGEPEAVPRRNRIKIGAKNEHGQRIFTLRDSVLVLKDDGVYRVDGDVPSNLSTTVLDNTLLSIAPKTAVLSNNTVYFLSDQGVSSATATSVEVVSRDGIELPLQSVVGNSNISTESSAVAYESKRLYILTTLAPNSNSASIVYVYNQVTKAWTTWDKMFKNAVIGFNDRLFMIDTNNKVKAERKNQNKLDFTDESYSITVNSVSGAGKYCNITSSSYIPKEGDVIAQSQTLCRIKTANPSATTYDIEFEVPTPITTGTKTIYEAYTATMKFSPFHGGLTNREKHFAQFQVKSRDRSISTLYITFTNDIFGGSEETIWRLSNVAASGGWGNEPWGFFEWGLEDGINLSYSTKPATPIRTYIPRFAARATFIQPVLIHKMGAEPMNIQSIAYQLRPYEERVSK